MLAYVGYLTQERMLNRMCLSHSSANLLYVHSYG